MEYEIVELEEKKVFGLRARTNNQAPDVGAVIGGLWDRFFVQGIHDTIPDKCQIYSKRPYAACSGGILAGAVENGSGQGIRRRF